MVEGEGEAGRKAEVSIDANCTDRTLYLSPAFWWAAAQLSRHQLSTTKYGACVYAFGADFRASREMLSMVSPAPTCSI